MTGYPWPPDSPLTSTDLNAAIGLAINTANTAATNALNATSIANSATASTVALQAALAPLAITLNWPAGLVVKNGVYVLTGTAPYGFQIISADASIGTAGGSMFVRFQNTGGVIRWSFPVSQQAKTNFFATGPGLIITPGVTLSAQISSVSGTPTDAYLTLNCTRT